jgi:hypothetical protein
MHDWTHRRTQAIGCPAFTARRRRQALTAVAALAITAITLVVFALPERSPGGPFPRATQRRRRSGGLHRMLPNGTALQSHPPSLRPPPVTKGAGRGCRQAQA